MFELWSLSGARIRAMIQERKIKVIIFNKRLQRVVYGSRDMSCHNVF